MAPLGLRGGTGCVSRTVQEPRGGCEIRRISAGGAGRGAAPAGRSPAGGGPSRCRRGGAPARRPSSIAAQRVRTCSSATCSTSRAIGAPTHVCGPCPNATCRLGRRSRRSRSASGNSASSRLALAKQIDTSAPAGTARSATSTSRRRRAAEVGDGRHEPQQLLDRRRDALGLAGEQRRSRPGRWRGGAGRW